MQNIKTSSVHEIWKGSVIFHDSLSGLFWTEKSNFTSYVLNDVRMYVTNPYFWK